MKTKEPWKQNRKKKIWADHFHKPNMWGRARKPTITIKLIGRGAVLQQQLLLKSLKTFLLKRQRESKSVPRPIHSEIKPNWWLGKTSFWLWGFKWPQTHHPNCKSQWLQPSSGGCFPAEVPACPVEVGGMLLKNLIHLIWVGLVSCCIYFCKLKAPFLIRHVTTAYRSVNVSINLSHLRVSLFYFLSYADVLFAFFPVLYCTFMSAKLPLNIWSVSNGSFSFPGIFLGQEISELSCIC